MKKLINILAVVLVAGFVGACAKEIKQFYALSETASNAEVPVEAMVAGISTFNGIEVIATKYTQLRRCNSINKPLCRDPAYRKIIDGAIYSGRDAREKLETFMRANPGKLGPNGLYNSLILATDALTGATATYRAYQQ